MISPCCWQAVVSPKRKAGKALPSLERSGAHLASIQQQRWGGFFGTRD